MTYRKVLFFWLPLVLAWLSMTLEGAWIQGVISRKTFAIYQAITVGFVLTTVIIWGGIGLGLHLVLAAAFGLTMGQLFELALLYLANRRGQSALRLHWQSAVAPT